MQSSEEGARAFNQGSDSRLRGEPMDANPYLKGFDANGHDHWRMGWRDVDAWYGRYVRGRWVFSPLPLVAG